MAAGLFKNKLFVFTLALLLGALTTALLWQAAQASHSQTRQGAMFGLFEQINQDFQSAYFQQTGRQVTIRMLPGSGAGAADLQQALPANTLAVALFPNPQAIAQARLLSEKNRLHAAVQASPYSIRLVFLVRKGNPKQIQDWSDLLRSQVQLLAIDPQHAPQSRWYCQTEQGQSSLCPDGQAQVPQEFVQRLYQHAFALSTDFSQACIAFIDRGRGDVVVAWEQQALALQQQLGPDKFDLVFPSVPVVVEPSLLIFRSLDEDNASAHLQRAYRDYLASQPVQDVLLNYRDQAHGHSFKSGDVA